MRTIVDAAFLQAHGVLESHRSTLEAAAAALLERETLTEAELLPFFEKMHETS